MLKCNTCGGTYEPILPDGMQYFHTCPPLSVVELRQALTDGTVQLSRADAQRLRSAQNTDAQQPVPTGDPTREELVLQSLAVDRPNKRDENVVSADTRNGRVARIKAEGLGTQEVPAP